MKNQKVLKDKIPGVSEIQVETPENDSALFEDNQTSTR